MNKSCSIVLQYNTEWPVLYWFCYFWRNEQYPILSNTRQKLAMLSIDEPVQTIEIPKQKVEDMRNCPA